MELPSWGNHKFGFFWYFFQKRESWLIKKHRNNKIKKAKEEEISFFPTDHQNT